VEQNFVPTHYYYYYYHNHQLLYAGYIYTYIPETNYVPREYSVAAILMLLFMVLISLVSVLYLLYFYISTFRNMCAVPNMAVFYSSLTSCFPGMLLTYFLNNFYYYYYYYCYVNSFVALELKIFFSKDWCTSQTIKSTGLDLPCGFKNKFWNPTTSAFAKQFQQTQTRYKGSSKRCLKLTFYRAVSAKKILLIHKQWFSEKSSTHFPVTCK